MEQIVEAVYEKGLFRPLMTINLPEQKHVALKIYALDRQAARNMLSEMKKVYEGLSEQELAEVENVALARGDFFTWKQ